MENTTEGKTFRLTPTWEESVVAFRVILENGKNQSVKDEIWEEIERMAKIADLYVKEYKGKK
jgi:hypothetical protein